MKIKLQSIISEDGDAVDEDYQEKLRRQRQDMDQIGPMLKTRERLTKRTTKFRRRKA
jgi:hypothetical protein